MQPNGVQSWVQETHGSNSPFASKSSSYLSSSSAVCSFGITVSGISTSILHIRNVRLPLEIVGSRVTFPSSSNFLTILVHLRLSISSCFHRELWTIPDGVFLSSSSVVSYISGSFDFAIYITFNIYTDTGITSVMLFPLNTTEPSVRTRSPPSTSAVSMR